MLRTDRPTRRAMAVAGITSLLALGGVACEGEEATPVDDVVDDGGDEDVIEEE
jgi:hypothetical protein